MTKIAATYGKSAKTPSDGEDQGQPALVYHTFFAEYKGDTPDDIIRSLHADSHRETKISLSGWWEYQATLWKHKYDIDVPDIDSENAAADMIKVLLKVGALEHGPRLTRDNDPKARP
jgi:hypothetical protein